MKIPFVGGSNTARSIDADNERTVNAYLEMQKQGDGNMRPVALYGMPGLVLRATIPASRHRGAIQANGFGYFVVESHVYRVAPDLSVIDCGGISSSAGRVGIATNGVEVMIVDGVAGWIVTDTLLSQIIDPDFPNGVTQVLAQDTYFIAFGDGSQRFYWSETPLSGVAWNGLDFASVEGSPDALVGGVTDHRQLWFIGTDSGEVYDSTGNPDQPFQRSGSSFMDQGTVSAWTVCSFDNSVVWLSRNKDGQGIFLRSQGGSPVRFSSHAVETALAGYSRLEDAFAWVFQMQGHLFYVVTFPTADATWFFDAASNEWFEWSWRDPVTNTDHRHRAASHVFVAGRHLVGDWEDGKIYSLEMGAFTDNGVLIRLLRRTQTLSDAKRLFFGQLLIDMETGVANANCVNPQVMLRYSDDGGRRWSTVRTCSIGGVGEFSRRVRFPASGSGRNRVWELTITDPVKRAVFGADVEVVKAA